MILIKIGEEGREREVCKSKLHRGFSAVPVSLPVCLPFTDAWIGNGCRAGNGGQRVVYFKPSIVQNQLLLTLVATPILK